MKKWESHEDIYIYIYIPWSEDQDEAYCEDFIGTGCRNMKLSAIEAEICND